MRKLLLSLMLLSAALLLPPSSSAQYVVVGQGCGASGLSAIANDGTPVVCRGNPLVWTAVGGGGGFAVADAIAVTTADFIHVQNSGTFSGFTEILTWRIVDSGGIAHNFSQSFTIGTGSAGAASCTGGVGADGCAVQISQAGNLVAASVGNTSGPIPGTDYFELFLLKQASYNGDPTQITATLISNYMESANVVFWPGGRAITSIADIPGEGTPVWGTGTSPAAGSDFSCTPISYGNCSGGGGTSFGVANVVLDSIYFTYTSSSQAATRQIAFEVGAGAPTVIHIPAPATQAASLTVNYTFCVGCANNTTDAANIVVALPANLFLNQQQSGFVWRTKTTNIQTSDTITNIQIRVRQKGTW